MFSSQFTITLEGDKGLHLEAPKFYCQASKLIIDYFVHVKFIKLTVPCEGTPKRFHSNFHTEALKVLLKKQEPKSWNYFPTEKFDFLTLVPWLSQTCLVLCRLGDLVEPEASHYLHHQILSYKY